MAYRNCAFATMLLSGVAGLALPAVAADTSAVRDDAKVVRLAEFDVNRWKDSAWFADELRGSRVFGNAGDQVGTVQSIVMDQEGQVRKLVVETGGVLDIGDKVIAVPWNEVDITPGKAGVVAKNLRADNVADFSLFDDRETVTTGPRAFRAAELEGDFVTLEGGENYGYVRDLMFDQAGKLQAIVVATDVAYDADGYYAYPYYGYDNGFDPGLDNYTLPYATNDIDDYEPFDYRAWGDEDA